MDWRKKYQGKDGLEVAGVAMAALKERFGTPLYVYDAGGLRRQAEAYRDGLRHEALKTQVIYASKAASFKKLLTLYNALGLGLDVVSEGELATALAADFAPEHIIFHGNNKLDRELAMALDAGVGTVILDQLAEAERLSALAQASGQSQDVLLRINPGTEAHTHAYIQTATSDSKFGVAIGQAEEALLAIDRLPGLVLRGVHCHIGSQIFAADSFLKAADTMLECLSDLKEAGLALDTLDLGGGFGVYYSDGDAPFDVPAFLQTLSAHVAAEKERRGLAIERLWIEPGRSLVNDYGLTLYDVGDRKRLADGVNYVFVDGGMGDNLRPALYEARYSAALAERPEAAPEGLWRVAGKYCESGDVLIRDLPLPAPEKGETLVVFGTGAYTFSMFSAYNRLPRPAVVMVEDGEAALAVRRETLNDLLALDV